MYDSSTCAESVIEKGNTSLLKNLKLVASTWKNCRPQNAALELMLFLRCNAVCNADLVNGATGGCKARRGKVFA